MVRLRVNSADTRYTRVERVIDVSESINIMIVGDACSVAASAASCDASAVVSLLMHQLSR
jgi:hypothetical protein